MFLTGKYKDSVGQKAVRRVDLVKTTKTACVSDELCRFKEEEEEEEEEGEFRRFVYKACIGSFGYCIPTVRVEALEYS